MFTGIVQTLGTVRNLQDDGVGGRTLMIEEPKVAPELILGESVSVNGVCLSVTESERETFRFQVGPETLARTNLGRLQVGSKVNLERALRVGDRLGGHFVTGHVDTVGKIARRSRQTDSTSTEWDTVWIEFPEVWGELMVPKGSIAVDGVSLTLVEVEASRFSVMLIPLTLAHTTLGFKTVGDEVNLETDMLAKHVQKLVRNLSITI